ncbi:hypothetical protein G9U51_12555 [Calidifontibacter sp. DB0510]|uniref:Uncharacterized protein n=1 Tax=Metallococcus carri TaxID=1656884 RepID=A0A967EFH0_9MICO|nr:DUF6350 family protein [Metallococcus carri]NHN56611.1 hypothetical protein [Metallococcus carri]NOP38910.1 hypothetical protein [Calidifontibacter sp. DB2511S]
MSLLERITPTSASGPSSGPDRAVLLTAAGYGVMAAAAGYLVLLVPVLAAWTLDPRSSTSWTDCLALAASLWGLVHHGRVSVPTNAISAVTFSPLLMTALAVVLVRVAARGVLAQLDDTPDERTWWRPWAVFAGGYVVAGFALAALSQAGPAPLAGWSVLAGPLLVVALGAGWALARDGEHPLRAIIDRLIDRGGVPLRRALRPAAEGAAALAGLGLLVLLGSVLMHLDRISAVSRLLDTSGSGTALLWLGQLSAVPNLIVHSALWATGAPVHVGSAAISTSSVEPGALPTIPLLGALPEAGALPGWAALMPLLPLIVGGFVGHRVAARFAALSPLRSKLQSGAAAIGVLVAGAVLTLWLSRMGVAPGRLAAVGASWWSIPLLALEFGAGVLVAIAGAHWATARRGGLVRRD